MVDFKIMSLEKQLLVYIFIKYKREPNIRFIMHFYWELYN